MLNKRFANLLPADKKEEGVAVQPNLGTVKPPYTCGNRISGKLATLWRKRTKHHEWEFPGKKRKIASFIILLSLLQVLL